MATSLLTQLFAINLLSYIPWSLIFLLVQRFGIRLYSIKKSEECTRIQNRLKISSHTTDGGKGYGYSCGYWYILHIQGDSDGNNYVTMIATEASYKSLTDDVKEPDKSLFEQGWKLPTIKEDTKITVLDRSGTFGNVWYRTRTRDAKDLPMGQQDIVVKTIIEDYMKRMHTVAYIHGNPGTGKSMIGILVANEFSSYFCNTLKPWQPGDNLAGLVGEAEPTPQKPLIVVFDEIDQVLLRIHEGIPSHKNMPTAVTDKSGWNHLLDSIQRGMYPNLILILTSNRGPEFINTLDSSYLRKGRVDNIFEMTQSLID